MYKCEEMSSVRQIIACQSVQILIYLFRMEDDNMLNIVILDGYTVNPGDLSWDRISSLGNVTVYDRTRPEEVEDRARDAEILLTNKTVLSEEILCRLPKVTYIGALSTGTNVIDLPTAMQRNITVTNIPEYATFATAQMTIALLLEWANQVGSHSRLVAEGKWSHSVDFSFTDGRLTELAGLTLGLFGYGKIAKRVAAIAHALGMRVLASSRRIEAACIEKDTHAFCDPFVDAFVKMTDLLRMADIISFHCPLTPDTKNIVCAQTIAQMKDGVFLLNTARGQLFCEKDVADALHTGKIAGIGVDVLSTEPPNEDSPLLQAPNCIITPHIAWAPRETRARLIETAHQNLLAYLSSRPQNVVLP